MNKYKYKCKGGDGTGYTGTIEASTLVAAALSLEKIYHRVTYLEQVYN
jgi:hypothetical protein